jgi:hypothetical protein
LSITYLVGNGHSIAPAMAQSVHLNMQTRNAGHSAYFSHSLKRGHSEAPVKRTRVYLGPYPEPASRA